MSADHEEFEEEYEEEGDAPERPSRKLGGADWRADLALGFLAMMPMLVAYEFAAEASRSTAEMLMLRLLSLLGELERPTRGVLLSLFALGSAIVLVRRQENVGVLDKLGRVAVEGVVLALVLGPVLVGLLHLVGVAPPALRDPDVVPTPARAVFAFGAAAWEELLFRVAAFCSLYLIGRRLARLLRAGDRLATGVGEAVGVLGSAFLFAGAHLASWTAWLGPGGEPYDESVFIWRLFAGILLALIFRWRGLGVAAWTHGLFNVAILLGAGPDVFL